MIEQHHAAADLDQLPTELQSPQGKLVYLCLEASDGATVDELGEILAMKKLAILSVLNSLSSQELIEQRDDTYLPRPYNN